MKYKRIASIEQYNEYCNRHEELTYQNYELHIDEIELLQILIDEYDQRTIDAPDGMNPVELLKYLLEENKLSKSELANQLGVSRQLITDILKYRRNISKDMVNKLASRFCLSSSAFNRPYSLKTNHPKQVRRSA